MIDADGYRANIAIIVMNKDRKVFWGRRQNQKSWQFPQGGMEPGETVLQAMYRELHEEVGLYPHDVEIISITPNWLKYRLPANLIRKKSPNCIGQKQKWVLLRLLSSDQAINLERHEQPEFDSWRWVSYWYPLSQVIEFKKHVYRKALEKFYRYATPKKQHVKNHHG